MQKKPLELNPSELKKMGLSGTCFWVVEYDLPHKHLKDINKGKKLDKETIRLFQHIRNKMMYALKFQIRAMQNLESSWFITEDKLEITKKFIEEIRDEMQTNKATRPYVNKIRIIPILTDAEGLETFEDRKAQFLLGFCMEAQKQVDKGLKIGNMYEPTLWRCRKTYEIVSALKEQLKGHKQYNEIVDTNEILADTIARYENMKETQKIKKAKEKGDRL